MTTPGVESMASLRLQPASPSFVTGGTIFYSATGDRLSFHIDRKVKAKTDRWIAHFAGR
jgi:hypothetical protein